MNISQGIGNELKHVLAYLVLLFLLGGSGVTNHSLKPDLKGITRFINRDELSSEAIAPYRPDKRLLYDQVLIAFYGSE